MRNLCHESPENDELEDWEDDIELEELPTVFKCDNCNKIRPMEECNTELAQMTYLTRDSAKEFICYRQYIQLCDECMEKMGMKEVEIKE